MKNKKLDEMLTKIDVACSVLQGRCESFSYVAHEGRIEEEKALAILRAAYTFVMEANTYMVAYLDETYKEKADVSYINSNGDDCSKPGMVPRTRVFNDCSNRKKDMR